MTKSVEMWSSQGVFAQVEVCGDVEQSGRVCTGRSVRRRQKSLCFGACISVHKGRRMGEHRADRRTLSETDFVVEQYRDLLAWLASDGQYVPVPVLSQESLDPGSFTLH
ncbi:hypothetical protein JB92DRAFT_376956 [Gautieria morchelliformis]|nr:hypothetical protein JB92DRAFT_376956 [Gautieria morchelliformis]